MAQSKRTSGQYLVPIELEDKTNKSEEFIEEDPAGHQVQSSGSRSNVRKRPLFSVLLVTVLVICVSARTSAGVSHLVYNRGDGQYRGSWVDWGPWGQCSTSCGEGTRFRVRGCTTVVCGYDHRQDESCKGECNSYSWNNKPNLFTLIISVVMSLLGIANSFR